MKDFLHANKGSSSLIILIFLNVFVSVVVLFKVRVENLKLLSNYSISDEVCEIKAIQAVKKSFSKGEIEPLEAECYSVEFVDNQARVSLENGLMIDVVYDDVFMCFESVEYSQ